MESREIEHTKGRLLASLLIIKPYLKMLWFVLLVDD